jgi:hypothetical protein
VVEDRAAAELEQAGPAVEAETAAVAAAPVVVGRAEEAGPEPELEPEEAEELGAGPERPASRASGWPQQQCSREACWAEFRA